MALGRTRLARGAQPASAACCATTSRRCATTPPSAPAPWCRWPTWRCSCRSRSAITPTSTPRASTPPTSAPCCAARTTPCSRTGCTCPSPTTAAPLRSSSAAPTCAGRRDRRRPTTPRRRPSARAARSISSWKWASSSAPATSSASRSPSNRRRSTSSAWCWSTTGAPATSSAGNTSRSARSWPRTSPRRSRPWVVTLDALEPFRTAGPKQDPDAAALPAQPRRLGVRHSPRSPAANGDDGPAARPLPVEREVPVLERLPATGPSHGQRLQPAAGRPAGVGHHQRADAGFLRQPAGTGLEGDEADRVAQRREAASSCRTATA